MPRQSRPPAKSALVPAAIRAPEVLSQEELDLNAEAIDTFTKAVGGREQLIDVLSVAAGSPNIEQLVNALIDPRTARYGLRKLCTMAGLTVADLFAAYRKATIAKAHIEATHIIGAKLTPIVVDVMSRAVPTPVACPACEGSGQVRTGQVRGQVRGKGKGKAASLPCNVCGATGMVQSEPDLDRQKLALELGQLTEKRGGLTITQNQGLVSGTALVAHGGGALEQLQQAVGELLFSPSRRRAASPRPSVGVDRAAAAVAPSGSVSDDRT